ncbi:MAG: ATP-binding cassette domain-containing protein, partial [Acidimicrobiales bacterium]
RDKAPWQRRRAMVLDVFPRLAERLNQPAGVLSGGEQQQLGLAKALLLEPKLLCVDELSLGLAPIAVEGLLDAVRRIRETGVTLLLVEQSLNIAAHLCERSVFLEKGQVRFEGYTQELLTNNSIARAVFLGGAAAR